MFKEKPHSIKLLVLTSAILILQALVGTMSPYKITISAIAGVLFLFLLNYVIHNFVHKKINEPKAFVRRVMSGTMLRLLGAVLFMAITLISSKKMDLFFVVSYLLSFLVFLIFELSEISSNLRLVSKKETKSEDA